MIDSDVLNSDVTLTGTFANTHQVTIHSNDGKNNTKVYTSREDVFFSFPSDPFECPVNYSRNGYRDRDTSETYGSTANKYFTNDKHFDCLYRENVPSIRFAVWLRHNSYNDVYVYLTNFDYYPLNTKIYNVGITLTFKRMSSNRVERTHTCRFTPNKNFTYYYEHKLDVPPDDFIRHDDEIEAKLDGTTSLNGSNHCAIRVNQGTIGSQTVASFGLSAPWLLG